MSNSNSNRHKIGKYPSAALTSRLLSKHIPQSRTSHIVGNAPLSLKELPIRWYEILSQKGSSAFGYDMRQRLELKEVSLEPVEKDTEGKRMNAKMVCELEVLPSMCNAQGLLDNGAMAALMDEGSAVAVTIMNAARGIPSDMGVSQTFNINFLGEVASGSKIKIVSRSVSRENDVVNCNSEIWDARTHKLLASGVQMMMTFTPPRERAIL